MSIALAAMDGGVAKALGGVFAMQKLQVQNPQDVDFGRFPS
jgi:hypothetical protein